MRIIQSLGQIEAKHRLKFMLGSGLKSASDACIRKPSSCYLDVNHPELTSRK
jgi:hypothetical protein